MAEYSGHFDKGASAPTYAAAAFSDFVALIKKEGVEFKYLNELIVAASGAGLSVTVGTGGAIVDGYYYITTAQLTKSIDAQSAGTNRIDRIVVRRTTATKLVEIAVLKGTAGTTPSAPALTQNDTVYEISLAQVYVTGGAVTLIAGNITDERIFTDTASNIRVLDSGGKFTGTDVEAVLLEIANLIATANTAIGLKLDASKLTYGTADPAGTGTPGNFYLKQI
jgi:hypothetical protein